jgi:hypothetical protein
MELLKVMEPKTETPKYRLVKPFYVNDIGMYVEEGREILWDGVPNEEMEPLNKAAEDRLKAYLATLEEGRLAAGHTSSKIEDILFEAMRNRPREPQQGVADNPRSSTKVDLPKYNKEVPPTGNLKKNGAQKGPNDLTGASPLTVLPQPDKAPPKPISLSSINKEPFNASE